MGKCPGCGKQIEEVVLEPISVHLGVELLEAWAYRCVYDDCAVIITVTQTPPDRD